MENTNQTQQTQQTQQPQVPVAPVSKKRGGLMKILIGVIVIAILALGGWYAYNLGLFSGDADDTPPALTTGGAKFQGKFVDTTYGFLQFDTADISNYVPSGANLKKGEKGVNHYFAKVNMTFDQAVKSIKPKPDFKILLVKYDALEPWAGNTGTVNRIGCFKTYPVGLYDNTCEVPEADLSKEIILKDEAFTFISNIDFEYDSNFIADAKTPSNTATIGDLNGWVMYPLSSSMDLTDSRIKNLWVQKNVNEFEKVTSIAGLDAATREYKMAWFKLGDAVAPPVASGGGTDIYQDR